MKVGLFALVLALAGCPSAPPTTTINGCRQNWEWEFGTLVYAVDVEERHGPFWVCTVRTHEARYGGIERTWWGVGTWGHMHWRHSGDAAP